MVAVSLGVLAWRRRPRPGATEFAVLSLVAAGWLAAHGGMLLAPAPDAARTWFLLSQAFLNYLPVPWLLFTLAYADVGPTIRRRLAVVSSVSRLSGRPPSSLTPGSAWAGTPSQSSRPAASATSSPATPASAGSSPPVPS
ncbi:histidine kinase N-terminal 7TM domain-containing protein [Salinigranum marinum]|uniref:histidine kinase N-terminal 7TM domain-containing protein n=1 Tax=Salinigranum marinum TaxID=1515595 RepID=UPI003CCCBE95